MCAFEAKATSLGHTEKWLLLLAGPDQRPFGPIVERTVQLAHSLGSQFVDIMQCCLFWILMQCEQGQTETHFAEHSASCDES